MGLESFAFTETIDGDQTILDFENAPVKQMRLKNAKPKNNETAIGFEVVYDLSHTTLPPVDAAFQVFAIDPSQVDFESASFTIPALGETLWKCKDWNFEAQSCFGDWVKLFDMQAGQTYDVELGPTDPGYAVSNRTLGLTTYYQTATNYYGVRTWEGGATGWSSESNGGDGTGSIIWSRVACSPKNYSHSGNASLQNCIVVTIDNQNKTKAYVWNGQGWSGTITLATINGMCGYAGGTGGCGASRGATARAMNNYRSVDVVFEQQSGRGIAVFGVGNDTLSNATPYYSIWSPSTGTWSAPARVWNKRCTNGNGTPLWIELAANPSASTRTNEITMVYRDATYDYCALIWDGSSWGSNYAYNTSTAIPPYHDSDTPRKKFVVEYEQNNSQAVIMLDATASEPVLDTDALYASKTWDGSWGADTLFAAAAGWEGRVIWAELVARENSDQMVVAGLLENYLNTSINSPNGPADNAGAAVWNGTAVQTGLMWRNVTFKSASTGRQIGDVAYINQSNAANQGAIMLVYGSYLPTNYPPEYVYCANTSACYANNWVGWYHPTVQTCGNASGGNHTDSISLQKDPNSEDIMLLYSTNSTYNPVCSVLFNGTSQTWGTMSTLEASGNRIVTSARPFDFDFYRAAQNTSAYFTSMPPWYNSTHDECTGTANACSTYGDLTTCNSMKGCLWLGTCQNAGVAGHAACSVANYPIQSACVGNTSCVWDDNAWTQGYQPAVNATVVNVSQSVLFRSFWYDDISLYQSLFSWNASTGTCGTFTNDSWTAFSGLSGVWVNATKTVPAVCEGKNISAYIYANDSSALLNATYIINFTVSNIAPTVNTTARNVTETPVSTTICTNATASDVGIGMDTVWQTVFFPNSSMINVTLTNTSSKGACGGGAEVWSAYIGVGNVPSTQGFCTGTALPCTTWDGNQTGCESQFCCVYNLGHCSPSAAPACMLVGSGRVCTSFTTSSFCAGNYSCLWSTSLFINQTWANDSLNNIGVNNTQMNVSVWEAPWFPAVGVNNTAPDPAVAVMFNATVADDVEPSGYVFAWNGINCLVSVALVNDSWVSLTTNNTNATTVKTIPNNCESQTIIWMYYANDTDNHWNATAQQYLNVNGVLPVISQYAVNTTSSYIGHSACINTTIIDANIGMNPNSVYADILFPNLTTTPVQLTNSTAKGTCGGGGDVYSAQFGVGTTESPPELLILTFYGTDLAGNTATNTTLTDLGYTLNVTVGSSEPPYVTATGVNNTNPTPEGATAVMHNATLVDDISLAGYAFSWTGDSTPCGSSFANDSFVALTENNTNASITKVIPGACEGKLVQWRVYVQDSSGLWGVSQTQAWHEDTSVNASLPDIGSESKPSVFQMDKWYMIAAASGVFNGFDWNGTNWEQNATINASLPITLGSYSKPEVFQIGTQWFLIAGVSDGIFYGFDWTGIEWKQNASINASLPDIGSESKPSVFTMGTQTFLISGESSGNFTGFDWNGTGWTKNATINASLPDIGGYSIPNVFQRNSQWFMIAGETSGTFFGFDWNGTGWTQNSSINASLVDIGGFSSPSVFQKDGLWQLISGASAGTFFGFGYTPAYSVQTIAPEVTTKAVNVTAANALTMICMNATATDSGSGIYNVLQTVTFPNTTVTNITLQNSTSIDGCGGGAEVWSQQINVGATAGTLSFNTTYANDSSGTLGTNTTVLNVTVNSGPVLSRLLVNQTSPSAGESVMHNATVVDDTGLDGYIFSWNASGANCDTWTNDSWVSYTLNNTNISVEKVIPGACENKSISWRFYANDSLGAWGVSSLMPVWQQNSTINASLPDIGSNAGPSVFQIGTQWFMIAGRSDGNMSGFDWTGSEWEANSTINASLPDIGSWSKPSVFQIGTQWFMIAGRADGNMSGFDWNGTGWTQNATINASLPDIGTDSAPSVFQMGTQWLMIAGDYTNGNFFGFDWNGTGWTQNATINASLPTVGTEATPSVFQKGTQWFMIAGTNGGTFFGFDWTGHVWEQNSTINASLPDIGSTSAPSVFQMGTQWLMIAGRSDGNMSGFDWIDPYFVQNAGPVVSTMAVNVTAAIISTAICTNATVTDSGSGVSTVWQTVTFPNTTVTNITLQNSTAIDGCGGGADVWSQQINVGITTGNLSVNTTWANDSVGNTGSNSTTLNVTVYTDNLPWFTGTIANDYNPLPQNAVAFSTDVWDDIAPSGYVFSWTGDASPCGIVLWGNDSWIPLTGNGSSAIANKIIPGACEGFTLQWLFYANDSNNLWNVTPPTTPVTVQNVNPDVGMAYVNISRANPSAAVCINATVTDVGIGVDSNQVFIDVVFPNLTSTQIQLTNTTFLNCYGGGDVYRAVVNVGSLSSPPNFTISDVRARDLLGHTGLNTNQTNVTVNAPPYFPAVGMNNTNPLPGDSVMHNATIADDAGLSGYIFSWNASGASCDTWANDSWVSFTANNTNASITKAIPEACNAKTIAWTVYANDSANQWGNSKQYRWEQNATINASLPAIGAISKPSVFQIGTQRFMIAGEFNGGFFG
ncbi:MAG: hypothetical protein V1811_02730, partial [Candidatus Micrarchaeota archaeon]